MATARGRRSSIDNEHRHRFSLADTHDIDTGTPGDVLVRLCDTHTKAFDREFEFQLAAKVGAMLDEQGVHPDHKLFGWTALMNSCYRNHPDVVAVLVKAGASLDLTDDAVGRSSLMLACTYGHLDLVRLLITSGARISHRDKRGHDALYCAKRQGHIECVQLIEEKLAAFSEGPDQPCAVELLMVDLGIRDRAWPKLREARVTEMQQLQALSQADLRSHGLLLGDSTRVRNAVAVL